MRRSLFFFVLAACQPQSTTAEPTDPHGTDLPTGDTGTGELRLEPGYYTGTFTEDPDASACGPGLPGFLTLTLGTYPLNTNGDGFTLDYGMGTTEACEYGADGVTCAGYGFPVVFDATTTLLFDVTVPRFEVTGPTSFTQQEDVGLSCYGDGCTALETTYELGLPCTVVAQESWSR